MAHCLFLLCLLSSIGLCHPDSHGLSCQKETAILSDLDRLMRIVTAIAFLHRLETICFGILELRTSSVIAIVAKDIWDQSKHVTGVGNCLILHISLWMRFCPLQFYQLMALDIHSGQVGSLPPRSRASGTRTYLDQHT